MQYIKNIVLVILTVVTVSNTATIREVRSVMVPSTINGYATTDLLQNYAADLKKKSDDSKVIAPAAIVPKVIKEVKKAVPTVPAVTSVPTPKVEPVVAPQVITQPTIIIREVQAPVEKSLTQSKSDLLIQYEKDHKKPDCSSNSGIMDSGYWTGSETGFIYCMKALDEYKFQQKNWVNEKL